MIQSDVILIALSTVGVNIFISFIFTIILLKRYRKYKLLVPLFFVVANIAGIIAEGVKTYFILEDPQILHTGGNVFDLLFGVLSAFLILIAFNYFEASYLSAKRMVLATLLSIYALLGSIMAVISNDTSFFNSLPMISQMVLSFGPLVFFYYIMFSALRSTRRMKKFVNKYQRRLITYLQFFIVINFGGIATLYTVLGFLEINTISNPTFIDAMLTMVGPEAIILLGNFFLYLGLIRVDNPAALQPQRVDRFVIISASGIPIYSYVFESDTKGVDDTLLSGALTAIKSVLNEATQVAGDLEEIKIGSQHILLRSLFEYTGVLFTMRPTQYLSQMLDSTMIMFDNQFGGKDLTQLSEDDFSKIDKLISSTMTYTK